MKLVWPDAFVEEANLTYNISFIRKALGDGEKGLKLIETVPKRGYRFVAEVREVTAAMSATNNAAANEELTAPTPPHFTRSPGAEYTITATTSWPNRRKLALALASLVVLGVGFGVYKWMSTPTRLATAEPKVIPFTTFPGDEGEPTFSPDGNRIAFFWRGAKDDNADIYVKQPGAEGIQRLTSDPAEDTGPAWSPDGRLLAIVDKAAPQEPFHIFSLELDTRAKRPLTSPPINAYGDTSPAFSPDGKLFAFVRVPSIGVADIYVMPATGGEPRRLTFGNQPIGRVAWTPDSCEIVFERGANVGDGGLWRVAVSGGPRTDCRCRASGA